MTKLQLCFQNSAFLAADKLKTFFARSQLKAHLHGRKFLVRLGYKKVRVPKN